MTAILFMVLMTTTTNLQSFNPVLTSSTESFGDLKSCQVAADAIREGLQGNVKVVLLKCVSR